MAGAAVGAAIRVRFNSCSISEQLVARRGWSVIALRSVIGAAEQRSEQAGAILGLSVRTQTSRDPPDRNGSLAFALDLPAATSTLRQKRKPPNGRLVIRLRLFPVVSYATLKVQVRESSDNPRLNAFCRVAPSVRFKALAIFRAGVFFRAADFSSRNSVHERL